MKSQYDIAVIGSGAAGLLAALRASDHGLDAVVLEKTSQYGGTTATSGGAIWVPCHELDGHEDSREQALAYLHHTTGGMAHEDRLQTYLDASVQMVSYLEKIGVHFEMLAGYPDYYPEAPGSVPGRALSPKEIDGKQLGPDYLSMRAPFPAFTLFGRYSLGLEQSFALSGRLPGWQWVAAKMFLKYWLDLPWRMKTRRDRRATMGNALVGALRRELQRRNISVLLNCELSAIKCTDGIVSAIAVETPEGRQELQIGKALILAAGGFEQSQRLRDQNLPVASQSKWSLTPPGANSGTAMLAAQELGAATEFTEWFWWAPSMQLPSASDPDTMITHQMFFDHRHPNSVVVNGRGERFVNESCSYDDFGKAMIADQQETGSNIPCWMIFDATYRGKYGCGGIMPSAVMPDSKIPAHWWDTYFYRSDSISELARMTGLPAEALQKSVAAMNEFAQAGEDPQFGRGKSHYDQFFGDAAVSPNPALGPIDKAPFYAVRIDLGDLGTKGGLKVDSNARVIDVNGHPIAGLYAVGNCAASPFADCYPGSGGTIGPGMTFAYVAANHAASAG